LHIKVAHTQDSLTRLPDYGKGFWQNVIQAFSLFQALLKFRRFASQFLIWEGLDFLFQQSDFRNNRLVSLELACVRVAQQIF
jgi:hypothetical protein